MRPARVTEELAFEQVLWDGGAVNRDEWSSPARALGVQGPCDQFLARARLAGDEQIGGRCGHAPDEREDLLHGSRAADDVVQAIAAADLLTQAGHLVAQGALGQGLVDAEQELIDLEWLGDVVVGTELDSADRGVDGAEAGHDDDEGRGLDLADLAQQIQAVEIRHLHVRDHDVDATFLHALDPIPAARSGFDHEALVLELLLHPLAHVGVVVDHQDRGGGPPGHGRHGCLAFVEWCHAGLAT